MKIGELSKKTSCSVETIRFYEQQGLLPEPDRTASNYREYSELHYERLRFIRNCRSLDMAHTEIKELLYFLENPEANCKGVDCILEEHLKHVELRLKELQHLHKELANLRSICNNLDNAGNCNILHQLSAPAKLTHDEKPNCTTLHGLH